MMLNRKRPLRTYERKATKKPYINPLLSPVVLTEKYNPVYSNCFDESGLRNESLNNDPFESTFDRIAKGAVVPPMPLDTNENNSWKSSSSDSDVVNLTKAFNLFTYNDLNTCSSSHVTSKLMNRSNKVVRKCNRPRRNKSKMVIHTEIVNKKSPVKPKDKIQITKKQEQKRQRNKKEKMQSKSKKSNHNEQTSHANSGDINSLEDTYKNAFKYTSNYQQNIKPCFVELDACIVQNYILGCKKIMGSMQGTHSDVKFSRTDTLHTEKDISKEHNATKNFKDLAIKECFVTLYDNIKNQKLKTKESINDPVDTKNKSNISHSTLYNSSASCNTNVPCDIKRNRGELIKDSIVKMERLKIDECVKKDSMVCKEKKGYLISSTPCKNYIKPFTCLASISPINTRNTLQQKLECSISNVEEDFSNIVPSGQKNSPLIMQSKCNFDAMDIYENPTQISSCRETQTLASSVLNKTTSSSSSEKENIHTAPTQDDIYTAFTQDNIHTALTQKCNMDCKVILDPLSHSLNVFSVADSDKSLFSDTKHDYSSKNIKECKIEKAHLTNKSTDVIVDSSVDLCRINDNGNITTASPSKTSMMKDFEDLDNITYPEYGRAMQEEISTSVHENSKNEIANSDKDSFLCEDKNNINNSLLARLQDSIRVMGRRMRYLKWNLSFESNICEKSDDEKPAESKSQMLAEIRDIKSGINNFDKLGINNFEHSKHAIKKPLDHVELLDYTTQLNDDANKQVEKHVFLKPGKHWARSLSILNHINDGSDLNKLSCGKGKRWRHSVRDILDMQKQGIFQSCLKKEKDDADLSTELDTSSIVSSFDDDKRKTFNSTNHVRFSKRISVRVVPNNTTRCKIEDTSFLEAFGIKSEESPDFELSPCKESPTRDSRIIRWHSTTARDVVLQRCSQTSYLSFSYCFPDSYLEHCRKIGEGVYGEVFLYERLDKRSVIKIIPIEGEKLINGEPQKKFHEILSEIVITKELDNLRLNTTYKTSGFVEVRSIKCIEGKYPEKLIELWKTYDDNKTSDNDCPSIFDENQLYIALELGDGGEDLEAFVFQTAEEACALFLQTASALAVAEKALEFEHRDLHWGNVLISSTKEPYVCYNIDGKEIKLPSKGVKVSIIDFTLSRMLYQGCCIYNDLALDPALFTAHGEYQFDIYRLMREKIQNNWNKYEPYTNILWLHYTLDKMITAVRYKKKNLKVHKRAIVRLKEFKDIILNYDSAFDFATDSSVAHL
ncbi:uncharacterized protein LOC114946414 [Nylanderia fulva]|uniref:uncharacterized protein LOC114946414 n=1 Tax=Nylanderia fulva TaxID=613905 RepID=UPI0010FB1959|nr:uncharacterized protein LOC114946414 [Nylanderia fulva]